MVNSTVTAIVLVLLLIVQVYAGPALYVNRAQVNVRSDATVQSARVAVLQDGEELEQIGSEMSGITCAWLTGAMDGFTPRWSNES